MTGDFIYSAEREQVPFGGIDETGAPASRPLASRKIEKNLKRLLIFAAIIMGAEILWFFGISPCMPLSTVEINGFPGFNGKEVLSYAGIGERASFISARTDEAEKLLAGHYMVESARVIKRFPDRLTVYLEPRRAVALSLAEVQGRMTPVYYDKEGVVFRVGGERIASLNLPIISGIVFENPSPGMKLPAAFIPLLAELGKMEAGAPELMEAVSEIQISRKPFDSFDIVLYPVHNTVRVWLESNINEEILRYVMLMLDVVESQDPKPEELDFRSGMGAYKIKEAPPGE